MRLVISEKVNKIKHILDNTVHIFTFQKNPCFSPSLFGIMTSLDDQRFDSWQEQDIFLVSKMSRPSLGPSQPPVQLVLRFLPWEESDRSVKPDLYFHICLQGTQDN
jgi:hypothetical protein